MLWKSVVGQTFGVQKLGYKGGYCNFTVMERLQITFMLCVLIAEHPMSRIYHCSTLSSLVKCVTFISVLGSVHRTSCKALLPHSV